MSEPAAGRTLRILLVSHYALPHLGGIEVIVATMARELARRGHDVVHVAAVPGEESATGQREGYRLIRVPALNVLERRLEVPFPLFAPSLGTVLRREVARADVVHVHGLLYLSSALALALARRRPPGRRPVRVLTEHVGHVPYSSPLLDRIEALAIATLGRRTARSAQAIVTMNPKVAEDMRRLAPGRPVDVMYLGRDLTDYGPAPAPERAELRRALGWDERPRVLFVGRLVAKKGVDLALETAAAGRDAFELVMVGPGTLRQAPPANVHLLGPLPPTEVARLYRAADAFLLPSRGEGFPVTVMEAMASGLPVVLADDPAYVPHVAPAGSAARVVPPRAEALTGALRELLGDEQARRDAGRAAAEHARLAFSSSRTIDLHEELYARLRAGRGE